MPGLNRVKSSEVHCSEEKSQVWNNKYFSNLLVASPRAKVSSYSNSTAIFRQYCETLPSHPRMISECKLIGAYGYVLYKLYNAQLVSRVNALIEIKSVCLSGVILVFTSCHPRHSVKYFAHNNGIQHTHFD